MSTPEKRIPWKIRDVFYVFILMLALLFISLYLIYALNIKLEKGESLKALAILAFQWTTMLIPLYIFGIRKYKGAWKSFGLTKQIGVGKLIQYILGGYFAYILIGIAITYLITKFGVELPGYERQEPHLPIFGDGIFDLSIAFVAIVLIAPIIEEVFFRGFILQTLIKRIGWAWGSLFTAFLFALIHVEFQSMLGLMILSLIINELFLRSKSIWVPIGFHMLNNGLAFLAEYLILNGIISL